MTMTEISENPAPPPLDSAPNQEPEPKQLVPPEELKKSSLKDSAALVPVGPHGAAPMNLAQQMDLAQFMCKGNAGVPEHLRGNPADCLAIIQMADAVGLHPFLLAQKAYVQKGRLAFESQAFHAMLMQSGKMHNALRGEWKGEGDDMTCTVWGTLKGEDEPHYYESPPVRDLHPGHNKDGFVKGSPLWDKKPKVQLWYDTVRDWVRMFCPTACLGMYALEEFEETPVAGELTRMLRNTPSGLADRLKTIPGTIEAEGHREGHADAELDKIAPQAKGRQQQILPAEQTSEAMQSVREAKAGEQPEPVQDVSRGEHAGVEGKPSTKRGTKKKGDSSGVREGLQGPGGASAAEVRDLQGAGDVDAASGLEQPAQGQVAVPEASSAGAQKENVTRENSGSSIRWRIDADATVLKAQPKTWQDYEAAWIKLVDGSRDPAIIDLWKSERPIRESLNMPVEPINNMRTKIEERVAKIKGKK